MGEEKKINQDRLALLEAILFTTDEPLKIEKLQRDIKGRKDEIQRMLDFLKDKYNKTDSGIRLSDIGGYRLVVKGEYITKVSHLTPHADMSRGLLRVLSIIAYHEPIKQSDIVKVVGNRTYEYTKQLEEKGLIKSERKSRTKILSTTPHFEDYFGAKKEELKKMFGGKKDIPKEENKEPKKEEQPTQQEQQSEEVKDGS